jgi:uncharacterized membrane protein
VNAMHSDPPRPTGHPHSGQLTVTMIAATAVAAGLTSLVELPVPGARAILATLLALVLPGSALVAAFFPLRSLGDAERLLFSVGLSLTIAVIGGLALNALPGGLQPGWWVALLVGTTVLACAIALVRRHDSTAWPSFTAAFRGADRFFSGSVLLVAAALVAVTAVLLAADAAATPPSAGVTQLWMLPSDAADQSTVGLGVRNLEHETMRYRLVITVNGKVADDWPAIDLAPGETWQITRQVRVADTGNAVALLYRADDPATVYRRVALRGSP